jgi:hypothetical protein
VKSWFWFFLVLPCLAQADVAVTETFAQSQASPAPGQHISWFTRKGKIQVVKDPLLGGGNAFKGNSIVGILPFATLTNPGESVTVHFNFRLAGPVADSDHGFKLGFYEGGDPNDPWFYAAGTGYRWNISTGGYPIPASVVKESGGRGQKILSGQDSNVMNQSRAPFSINDTAKHTATIVMKMGDNGLNLTLAIDGKKFVFHSTDLLPPSTLSPTRFAIRSDANTFLFDDFVLTIKAP